MVDDLAFAKAEFKKKTNRSQLVKPLKQEPHKDIYNKSIARYGKP